VDRVRRVDLCDCCDRWRVVHWAGTSSWREALAAASLFSRPGPGPWDLLINPVRVTHDLELGIPGLPFPMHTKVRLVRPSKASSERLTTLYRKANNI
jgi:hypothetical protein